MKKYELLAEDIEALIASGTIQPGERLPSVRQTITAPPMASANSPVCGHPKLPQARTVEL